MVKLLPSFIRKIIPQKGVTIDTVFSSRSEKEEKGDHSAAASPAPSSPASPRLDAHSRADSFVSSPRSEPYVPYELCEYGITSNIATVALRDWGYPVLETAEDKNKISGKCIAGFLRNYVNNADPLEAYLTASKTSVIPKVDESDFSEYIRQISVLYITMEENAFYGENLESGNSSADSIDFQVPKEYYNEDYDVAANEVFRKDLKEISSIMATMEKQLSSVNGELQELLERRYGHVHEACMNVEELYKRFMDVTNQINRIRIDLEGGTVKPTATPFEQEPSSTIINKEEVDWILESGMQRKRSLQAILEHLYVIRAVSQLPEYIQAIADSSGLALVNIFRDHVVHYLRNELSKFKVAESVAEVLGETMSNVQRVAETKLINLVQVALLELSNYSSPKEAMGYLQSMLNQTHQPIIALVTASSLQSALETLENISNGSKSSFKYKSYDSWEELLEAFQNHGAQLSSFLLLCNLWGAMLLRRILCIELSNTNRHQSLSQEASNKLVKKVIDIIQERLSSGPPGSNMPAISHISSIIRETIALPQLCNDTIGPDTVFQTDVNDDTESSLIGESTDTEDESNLDSDREYNSESEHDSSEEPDEESHNEPSEAPLTELIQEVSADNSLYPGYVASVKRTIDAVASNTFQDFTDNMVFLCNLPVDFEVYEFVNFLESFKEFKKRYQKLLAGIKECTKFASMLSLAFSDELKSKEHISVALKVNINDLLANADSQCLLSHFQAVADRAMGSVFNSCLEPLKLSNIINMQKAVSEETWEEYKLQSLQIDDTEASFALVISTVAIDERLKLYTMLSEAWPNAAKDVAQDGLQLMGLYNSLLDVEVSVLQSVDTDLDDATIRKACLMVESLRYFSNRLSDISYDSSDTLEEPQNLDEQREEVNSPESDRDNDSRNQDHPYSTTEKCSDDLETLKQRILHIVSSDIGTKMKRHMLIWVLQSPDDPYDDQGLKDMIKVVQQSVDVIQAVLMDIIDVQMVFEVAFQQLHASIPKEEIDVRRTDELRDSCMELITGLSHNSCIKLEVCWLADTLSNELFS